MTLSEFLMTFPGGVMLGLAVLLPIWGIHSLVALFRRRRKAKELEEKIKANAAHFAELKRRLSL